MRSLSTVRLSLLCAFLLVAGSVLLLLASSPSERGLIVRVSVASDGAEGIEGSGEPAISGDGQVIAFVSSSNDLVPDGHEPGFALYVHDRHTPQTERFPSLIYDSAYGLIYYGESHQTAISADGRVVAIKKLGNIEGLYPDPVSDIFLFYRATGHVERVSVLSEVARPQHNSNNPVLSSDGRFVAFESSADNLVPGDSNERTDVFVRDMLTGAITQVSRTSDGGIPNETSHYPAISANGRWIAFISFATNMDPQDTDSIADVYIHDHWTGVTALAWKHRNKRAYTVTISPDGRYLGITDLVQYDYGAADHELNMYVYDLDTGQTLEDLVGISVGPSDPVAIGDGPVVAFSTRENLLPEDTNDLADVYRYDFTTQQMRLVSMAQNGHSATGSSVNVSLSGDGEYVAFASGASDLVYGDTNEAFDVFVWSAGIEHIFIPLIR